MAAALLLGLGVLPMCVCMAQHEQLLVQLRQLHLLLDKLLRSKTHQT